MALQDPVAVYDAADNLEAQLICSILNDAGIEAYLTEDVSQVGVWLFGLLPGIHKPQVWADREDMDRIKPVLENYERQRLRRQQADAKKVAVGETTVGATCEECGRQSAFPAAEEGTVQDCPHCGAYMDVEHSRGPDECRGGPESTEDTQGAVDVPDRPASQEPSALPLSAKDNSCERFGPGLAATRRLWFEVVAVLCLAVIPDLFVAVADVVAPRPRTYPFVERELYYVVRTLQVSLPLLLILSLTREPWARFGVVRFSWFLDVASGTVIWICGLVARVMIVSSLPQSVFTEARAGTDTTWARPEGVLGAFLVLAASVANGFAEELVMRGYLLTRLERLLHSTGLAILVTTALFASYHVYQGAIGLAGATAVGLVYGSAYCLQRRLWPVCIAHAIANFIDVMRA